MQKPKIFNLVLRTVCWFSYIAIILTGCINPWPASSPRIAEEHQTITPVATIVSFDAIPTVPDGQSIFIAVSGSKKCNALCNCPQVEAIQEPYSFYDKTLTLNWSGYTSIPNQTWTEMRTENRIIGIYTFYNLISAKLDTFSSLPYATPDGKFVIIATDKTGAIAVKAWNGTVRIEAGKGISQQSTDSDGALCQIMYTTTIKNYGFIKDEQVTLR